MKQRYQQRVLGLQTTNRKSRCSGFSLVELMVAMAIFVIIAGVATNLFKQHTRVFAGQQSQVAMNYNLRNAITQMQIDVSRAGDGFYQAADTPGWPIGITVVNQKPWVSPAAHCWDPVTFVYSWKCFDTLNVIVIDRNTPPGHPSDSSGNSVSSSVTDLYLTPVAPMTPTQLASAYKAGDQILFVNSAGTMMTTAILTAPGTVDITHPAYAHLQHGQTGTDGTNSTSAIPPALPANDHYYISTTADTTALQASYTAQDWVLKLSPITYQIDTATDPTNPKLVRFQAATGTTDVIAEQIIGFKVGVSVYDHVAVPPTDTDDTYQYTLTQLSDFTKVRAVRISLVSRTAPSPVNPFRNAFDSGPYKIEAASVVVNPRSLSMKDR